MTNFWDFTAGTLPTGATLTRASAANYYNSSGIITSAATNSARFDYNPTPTIAYRGLLYEPAEINNFTNSYAFAGSGTWGTFDNATLTDSYGTAPDGTTSSTFLGIGSTTGVDRGVISNATAASSGTATLSVYMKKGTLSVIWLSLFPASGTSNAAVAVFDLNAGTILNTSQKGTMTYTSSSIQYVGNGWYRCTVTGIDSTYGGYAGYLVFGANGSSTDQTSTSGGIEFWGAQVEPGPYATSYIISNGSAGSRSADVLNLTIPSDGSNQITITFDDNSTQTITGLSAGSYNLDPTVINRAWIKYIQTNTYVGGGGGVSFYLSGMTVSGITL